MIPVLIAGAAMLVVAALVALYGVLAPCRCDVPGCSEPGRWQSRDAGPGALCDAHSRVEAYR